MSLRKITQLLSQGSMINANLTSDSLNSFLSDLCQVVIDQSNEIIQLKKRADQMLLKKEFDDKNQEYNNKLEEIKSNLQQMNSNTSNEINISKGIVKKIQDSNIAALSKVEETFNEKIKSLQQNTSSDIMICQQKARVLQAKTADIETKINIISQSVDTLKNVDDSPLNEISILKKNYEQLHCMMNDMTTNNDNRSKQFDNHIKEIIKTNKEFKSEIHKDMRVLTSEVKEICDHFTDLPEFKNAEGEVDTETLIRAIQRNSRRIDNFNETITTILKEHCKLHGHYDALTDVFNKVQQNISTFAHQYNADMNHWGNIYHDHTIQISNIDSSIKDISNDINLTIDVETKGLQITSSLISQLQLFISKLTTRQLPTLQSYDDTLIECQRISDLLGDHIDDFNHKKSQFKVHKSTSSLKDPVTIPFYEIKAPTLGSKLTYLSQSTTECPLIVEKSADETALMDPNDINEKIENMNHKINEMESLYGEKFDLKADVEVTNKNFDRIRGALTKIKSEINLINQTLIKCVKNDEIDFRKLYDSEASSAKFNRAQKSVLSSLPQLTGNPHDLIYGKHDNENTRINRNVKYNLNFSNK